jgi:predicted outer membrane repeat protein
MQSRYSNPRVFLLGIVSAVALTGCLDRDTPTDLSAGALFTQVASGPVVNSLADPGSDYTEGSGTCDENECTLREAIDFASPGATITFAPDLTGTITLQGPQLFINKSLTIAGPGAADLAVSGDDQRRVFLISGTGINVEIRDLTIRDGNAGSGAGVSISTASSVLLDGVVVTENVAVGAYTDGGGIRHGAGVLTLRNSTVSNNTVGSRGGGIFTQGTLVVENSTISGNVATGDSQGGGIFCMTTGTVTLTNSTVSGNTGDQGGGMFVASPPNPDDPSGWATLTHSTVTANTGSGAAGILNYGTVTLNSSILAGNTGPDILHWGYAASTASFSLIGTTSTDGSSLAGSDNLVDVAPLLNPLASNGGPTQTHALQSGSLAIDYVPAGTNGCGTTMTTDQRGVSRPQGSACDIGALERVPSSPSFTSSCTFMVNLRNGMRTVIVTWADAEPGVTLIEVADGKISKKQMAPTAAGSWTTNVKSDPTYGIWGGTSRKDTSKVWVPAGTACTG